MKKVGSIPLQDAAIQKALANKAEGSNYVGAGDNLIDFHSASSFINEDNSGKRFQIKISNAGASDCKINLNPAAAANGYLALVEGEVRATDGTGAVTASGSPRAITTLLAYIKANPTRIQQIKLKVDDPDQLDEPIVLRKETPWMSYTEEQRVPSDFQSSDTNNENMATIDDVHGWMFSPMDTLLYSVRAGRTVNISVTFGGSLDCAKGLNAKAKEAAENVTLAYARQNA